MEILKVSASSKLGLVAVIREEGTPLFVEMKTIGAGALNQAIKAIAQ